MKEKYIIGFSKGQNHYSYIAELTGPEYVELTALLAANAHTAEVVKEKFYELTDFSAVKTAIRDLL